MDEIISRGEIQPVIAAEFRERGDLGEGRKFWVCSKNMEKLASCRI